MKRLISLLLMMTLAAKANEPVIPQPMPEVLLGTNNTWNLRWYGLSGRSYFIEVSDDLKTWHFAPVIEPGNDEEIEYEMGSLKGREFVRLVYTDQTAVDLDTADFDGDGLGNLAEITVFHTHPLRSDSDNDGLDDKWEIDNGLDPNDDGSINPDNGGNGDPDGDGSINLAEQAKKTKPSDNKDFPVQLVSVRRSAEGVSTEYGNGSISDLLELSDWANNFSNEHPGQRLTPSLLSSRLGTFAPFPASIPEKQAAPGLQVETLDQSTANAEGHMSGLIDGAFASINGWADHSKVWLRAPAGPDPMTVRLLKVTKQLSTPWATNTTAASNSAVTVETFTIPASAVDASGAYVSPFRESQGVELVPNLTFTSSAEEHTKVSLREIKIVPAANMAGVVGDMIPSNQAVDPELHFVTPKKSSEIPDDFVVFEATGLESSEIEPGPNQLVTWDGGESVPDHPLQRRVKRDQVFGDNQQHGHSEVRLLTIPQQGSPEEVAK